MAGSILFHDVRTGGQQTHKLSGHSGMVRCMQFDSTVNLVVSGSTDRTVRVFDLRNSKCTATLNLGAPVTALHFAERICAAGCGSKWQEDYNSSGPSVGSEKIQVWDFKTQKGVALLADGKNSESAIVAIRYEPRRVVCISKENRVKIYDLRTAQRLAAYQLQSARCVVMDGEKIVRGTSVTQDNAVVVQDFSAAPDS